ncbi:P-loop containing nucleoside triphosphate hydrolase protein, partial [Chlamydoabsidia padenii]
INQLNEYQKEAVTADNKYLQVLAGPGSGKTRVLTTRVAWLIKEKKLKPSSVVVVTFTNKAAKEMKERLEQPSLLGTQTKFLRMGTFHSFCCRMLQRHLDWIPLKKGFSIADTTKSKHLVDMIFKDLKPRLSKFGLISKAKNKGLDHHQYMAKDKENDFEKDVAMVFSAYEETLLSSNMVDFDGLLLHGRDLFKSHPQSVNFVQHVLVDEFQDTNALQYEITALLTGEGRKALTVVGDPDQSIYGWRNANKEHFDFMESDYKGTRVVDLKENYRSTANIISGASRVVEADKSRKPREHFTNNHSGVPISVLKASSELDEASVVVDEIKRIIKYSNGLINNKDIAILFRMNFLTLNFENALNRERIPYILVGGTRFLDRMEVKDVLGYLSFFYNPRDVSAFIRLINVPKRGLGDVSVKKIQSVAAAQNWTLVEALDHIVAGHPAVASIRIMAKSKMLLKTLLILYNEVEAMMTSPGKILKHIIDAIGYMEYLETDYKKDYESRKANVEELITFANRQGEQEGPEDESGMDAVGRFLEYCTLSGDSKEHEEAKGGVSQRRISLITIHSAKGLEWPCVFIAGCEDGIIPMSRAEDPLEESRVLYVGMTRAKCFLY